MAQTAAQQRLLKKVVGPTPYEAPSRVLRVSKLVALESSTASAGGNRSSAASRKTGAGHPEGLILAASQAPEGRARAEAVPRKGAHGQATRLVCLGAAGPFRGTLLLGAVAVVQPGQAVSVPSRGAGCARGMVPAPSGAGSLQGFFPS